MGSSRIESRWLPAVAVCFAFLVLSSGIGRTELWDRDEPRNAGCTREMLERGDWIVPVFNGRLRTDKPILVYWLMMASYGLFGDSEFAARLPSALLATGTCLLVFFIGSRLATRATGLLAMGVLATTLMFNVAAHAATPDAALIFLVTASLALFVHFAWPLRAATDYPALLPSLLIYGVTGLAVLAKGPAGFVLPCAVIGLFLLSERSLAEENGSGQSSLWTRLLRRAFRLLHPGRFFRTVWQMRPLTLVAAVLLVSGPWYLLVGLRTNGEWLTGFFLDHNIRRATESLEGHSGSVLWFYPLAILIGFFPWSIWAVPTGLDAANRTNDRCDGAATRFLLCWIVAIVGIFSVAKTKLPSYVTPVYPAVAILVARSLLEPSRRLAQHRAAWRRLADAVLILVGCGLAVGIALAARRFLPGLEPWGLIGAIPVACGVAGWRLAAASPRIWTAVHLAGAAVLLLVAFGALGPAASRARRYDDLVDLIRQRPDAPLASLGALEPSWVYYSGRIWQELDGPGAPVPVRSPGKRRPTDRIPLDRYLARYPNAWIVVTDDAWRRMASWHGRFARVGSIPFFLRDRKLIVLRPRNASAPPTSRLADRPTTPAPK